MASASRASRRPVSLFVSAAALLIHTTASTNGASGNWWEMGKLRRGRLVWKAYNTDWGGGGSPRGCFLMRGAIHLRCHTQHLASDRPTEVYHLRDTHETNANPLTHRS